MRKWICTDPDSYQWQYADDSKGGMPEDTLYSMCEVISVGNGWSVLKGMFTIDDWDSEIPDATDFCGYNLTDLLLRKDYGLIAECIWEYDWDSFVENPYGPSPVYDTPEEACKRCDEFMNESHEDMWLRNDSER